MTTALEKLTLREPQINVDAIPHSLPTFGHERLTRVFRKARSIPFDDSSRFVFFSDCHRGNNGRTDAFAKNEELFLQALSYYYQEEFTYIELGDGDELWRNCSFRNVRRAHSQVFDLLHRFERRDRLHLIWGNHDVRHRTPRLVEKDGIPAHEGLVLRHARTGQGIFAVHGHQVDFCAEQFRPVSRVFVRLWDRLEALALKARIAQKKQSRQEPAGKSNILRATWREFIEYLQDARSKIENRLIAWTEANQQMVVCGHTHRPACSGYGQPPFFNTGSCLRPGIITGLEIQENRIAQVRWSAPPASRRARARRELVTPRQSILSFA